MNDEIYNLLILSDVAYQPYLFDNTVEDYNPVKFDANTFTNHRTMGFLAHSYYSKKKNTLVVAYAGTNDALDLWADLQLGVSGWSIQHDNAIQFAEDSKKTLE